MDPISAVATSEDSIDISAVRILDLRTLGQDEICCLARICGDVPERLQDLVNVIVDKSIFNESAGSKRQTFDRDRLPRNKERRLSSGSASAQLHFAIESAGRSHKDLIVHLCRQLKISEKGDRALFQPQVTQATQASGVVAEGNRSMSLKRMARASASLAGRSDGAMLPLSNAASEVLVNGKELPMEVLHRSSKKMKTKEEARRRAAESSQAGAGESEMQENKHALLAVKITSSGHDEPALLKDIAAEGMTTPTEIRNDFWSPGGGMAGASNHLVEAPEASKFTRKPRPHKGVKLLCNTCGGSFSTMYSLRRHTVSTGHDCDAQLLETEIVKKKKALNGNLRCSCGNTFATPYTLKRHAVKNGHSLSTTSMPQATTPASGHHQEAVKSEELDGNAGIKLGKQKLGALLPERAWKSKIGHYTCRHCHRQFIRKKIYIRHMGTHFQRTKKKSGKTGHELLGGPSGASNEDVKPRIGRPPKYDRDVDAKQGTVRQKRKRELASPDRLVRPRNAERRRIPSEKPQSFTCQECGKIYDEFSRYSGHLSMHARLRKVIVGETSSAASAIPKNMLNLKELSALGFRKLLNDKTGTYLSSFPAKLLFSKLDFAIKQKGQV